MTFKDFVPPILLKIHHRLKNTVFIQRLISKSMTSGNSFKGGWYGEYSSWKDAQKCSTGYDAKFIAEKVLDSMLKVKNDPTLYELDANIYKSPIINFQLLFELFWVSSQRENQLNILDFGGSLGSTYFGLRNFLFPGLKTNWHIIEQKHINEIGKNNFETKNLKFFSDFNTFHEKHSADILLLSGVLQCIEDLDFIYDAIKKYKYKYIIIDRTPFFDSADKETIITVQKLPKENYGEVASFPCKIFNFNQVIKPLSQDYEIIINDLDFLKYKSVFAKTDFSFRNIFLTRKN